MRVNEIINESNKNKNKKNFIPTMRDYFLKFQVVKREQKKQNSQIHTGLDDSFTLIFINKCTQLYCGIL